jgi:hypothetical protein
MNLIPTLRQITHKDQLSAYSDKYFKCSGLPIPEEYLMNPVNRVYAIFWKGNLIGGFILGRDTKFRTIQFFANEHKQESVISQLGDLTDFTEICCFWIQRKYRTNTFLNIFVWLSMTYALRMYGTQYLLFGTCSRSLARLYGQTSKSIQIHRDRVNNKTTFIFKAHRSTCVTGMMEIISHKLKRTVNTFEMPIVFSKITNFVKQVIHTNPISHC